MFVGGGGVLVGAWGVNVDVGSGEIWAKAVRDVSENDTNAGTSARANDSPIAIKINFFSFILVSFRFRFPR